MSSGNGLSEIKPRAYRRIPFLVMAVIGGVHGSMDAAGAQEPYRLPESARATAGRSYVSAVAELPDGRLVVVDMLERAVFLYGPDLDSIGSVGGVGQGPREFLAPQGLSVMPDGRVLVQDVGNGRLLELDPEGAATGEVFTADRFPTRRPFSVPGEAPVIDLEGRWYFRTGVIPGDKRDGIQYDSVTLGRWSDGTDGAVQRIATRPVRHQSGPVRMSGAEASFSQPSSDWAVCGDGTVYVALPEPYRIRVFSDGDRVVEGPPIDFQPVAVTDAWVDRWWKEVGESTPSFGIRVRHGGDPEVGYEMRQRTSLDLPDHLPAIRPNSTHCGPADRAWVERSVDADQLPRIDVFDRTGTRIQRFDLPKGARIVGLGETSVYVVVRDDFDLEYLARLEVPIG